MMRNIVAIHFIRVVGYCTVGVIAVSIACVRAHAVASTARVCTIRRVTDPTAATAMLVIIHEVLADRDAEDR